MAQNGNGNNNNNNNAASSSASGSASPTIAPASRSGSVSGSVSGSATGGPAGNNTSSANSSTISIPATAAAGGIDMIQPVSTASTIATFYKIHPSEYITFRWNYTSLYVQPKSITVVAYCPAKSLSYFVGPVPTAVGTKAANMSTAGVYNGNTTQVVWNPYQWQQSVGVQFHAETYALRIYDERGSGSPTKGGYLAPYMDKTKFAMYFPQSYTPISSGWQCLTCSGIPSLHSPSTLPILMSIFIIVVSAWSLLRRA